MKRKQFLSKIGILFLLSATISILFAGCASRDFEKAKAEGTIAAYDQFLKNHPESEQAKEAKHLREYTLVDNALKSEDPALAKRYLQEYPKGRYSSLVLEHLSKIQDKTDWQIATTKNNEEGYRNYIEKHPKGEYIEEAKIAFEPFLWEKTKKMNTIDGYDLFLEKYPEGKFKDQAKQLREPMLWRKAGKGNDIRLYRKYLEEYPNGKFYKEALSKTDSLFWEFCKKEDSLASYDNYIKEWV